VSDSAPTPTHRRARKVRRGPILLVVLAAVVAAVVAQQGASSSNSASGVAAATPLARTGVSVPSPDVASSAWYCAEGTSTPDGRADETVIVASLASSAVDATITVMPGGDGSPKSQQLRLAPGEETRVHVADILATPEPGVVVETTGGAAAVSHQLQHDGDFAVEPCTRAAGPDWYFAAGTTVPGTEHDLAVFNPFGDDAIVDITFLTDTGVQQPDDLQAVVVPRRSRITIPVQDAVLRQDRVATQIHARVGRVVAERTQIFDGTVPDQGPTRQGIAVSLGTQAPALTQWFANGTTANGGTASLALANFGDHDARVQVHVVLVSDQTLAAQSLTVPARSVLAVEPTTRVPIGTDYAISVTAQVLDGRRSPIVAEVLSSWAPSSSTTGVASTLGSSVAARRWVVPQPDVDADAFLTVFDPGAEPVTAALLPATSVDRRVGPTSEPELAVGPGKAKIQRVTLGSGNDSAWVITAGRPIVVGLTLLGADGASLSSAIPDPSFGG
jgi:hypothetical protein